MRLSRRDLLGTISSSLALWPCLSVRAAVPGGIAVSPLAERLLLCTGAGANVLAYDAPDGLIFVDGGMSAHATALRSAVHRHWPGRRAQYLFNTHWHPEQTGSNLLLGRAGAHIIAHENTRLWLGTDAPLPLRDDTYGPLPAVARPAPGFYGHGGLTAGDESIEYDCRRPTPTAISMCTFARPTCWPRAASWAATAGR
jgi:glyoxylase-like metal-dependent hydrolase (beta-lactamase superfamily II)